jgi:hypothetical protein
MLLSPVTQAGQVDRLLHELSYCVGELQEFPK